MFDSIFFHSNAYFGYSATFVYFSISPMLLDVHFTVTPLPEGTDIHICQDIHQKD